jgi:23S rRNA (adenine2503-C2)-methyltransferase
MKPLPVKFTSELPTLIGMSLTQLTDWATKHGHAAFRGKQLYDWLYAKAVASFSQISNLPKDFRECLAQEFQIGRHNPNSVMTSRDGTKKYLYDAGNGKFIESAYIPDSDRATLCLSTQVGCKMGCLFCATARMGFRGHLTAGQIINQYLSLPERNAVTNLVYMGMGEPLDNPNGTFESIELFTDPNGLGISAKRITLSTIGLPGPLQSFLERFDSHLAISIHSPFNDERRSLMPIQHVHPISDTLEVLRQYTFNDHRRLSFEYIMFQNVNDSLDHARELVRLLHGLYCRVNLIHYHSVPGNDLQGSPRSVMETFQALLKAKGIMTTIRKSRGEDIQAACGLLSTKAQTIPESDPDF